MRTLALAAATCLLAASPRAARPESGIDPFLQGPPPGPPASGISFGLVAGYGVPMGSATGEASGSLSSSFRGSVPLELDLGWRFSPNLYAGAFFQYGIAALSSSLKDGCTASGLSCSGSDIRLGAEVQYTLLPRARIAPWLGLGVAYEQARLHVSQSNQSVDVSLKGFEFAILRAGGDVRFWPAFRAGPFVELAVGEFTSMDTPIDPATQQVGATRTFDIQRKALHEWLQFGIRGFFDL